jgi:MFS transporter, OFA family, oxalate/formate antiporter
MSQNSQPKGWPALVGGGLLNVALGTYYAFSAFYPALEKEFGWVRTQTSYISIINMVFLAIMFNVASVLIDRVGSRAIAVIGGLCFCLGMLLASFSSSLTMIYLSMALVGTGLGFGYLPPITVGFKWFPNQRGLVSGLAVGIFAAGSGIFGPVISHIIAADGWRVAFRDISMLFLAFTMVGAYLLKDPPSTYVVAAPKAKKASAPTTAPDHTPGQMLSLPSFYPLWLAYCFGTAAGTMVISQLVPFARGAGYSADIASFAITIGAIGSAGGRFFSGWVSDHFGRLRSVRVILVVSCIATPALYIFREQLTLFYPLLFLVYYCYGTQLSVYTALAGDFYGPKYVGRNYGILLLAWGAAGLLGPKLGAQVFVSTGNYQMAFFGAAGLAIAALVLLMFAKPPHAAPRVAHV